MSPTAQTPAALLGLALLALTAPVRAHELRPAFAELKETADTVELTVSWPLVEDAPGRIDVRLPAGCSLLAPPARVPSEDRVIERAHLRCAGDALAGAEIEILGLTAGVPEIVVRAELLGRPLLTVVARREHPTLLLGARSADALAPPGAASFVGLGVRHILAGMDHLLFVLGLLLLVLRGSAARERGLRAVPFRRLIGTVTAFTAAHTLTLGLATIGAISLPPRGVEAAIALSILAVAVELGRAPLAAGAAPSPWPMAFVFGLLHGFGFAGALRALGLPRAALPPALLFFNAGVELGQLAFVAACLLGFSLVQRLAAASLSRLERALVYAIGSLSAYWLLDRTLAMVG